MFAIFLNPIEKPASERAAEYARRRPAIARDSAASALLRAFLAVIFAISVPLASADAGNCAAGGDAPAKYTATEPPVAATTKPLQDGDGKPRTLAQYRGRGVVVNFWATWCAPCVKEMPALDRLKGLLAGDGITVLAVSEDRAGAPLVEKFYAANRIRNLDVLVDKGGKVLRDSRIQGLPTTLVVDARGLEVGRVTGAADWDSEKTVRFLRRCLQP